MSKKERTIVKVDEDKIKRMIAGDEPFLQEVSSAVQKIPEEEETTKGGYRDEIPGNERNFVYPSKRRRYKAGYGDIFLCKDREPDKKQTTLLLSASIFDRMEVLLSATKGLSMAMFVSNVLLHHFEEYEDDINAIKEKYIEKLSKKM